MKALKIVLAVLLSVLFAILVYFLAFVFSVDEIQYAAEKDENELNFTLTETWNGIAILAEDRVHLTLKGLSYSKDVIVEIRAPFYYGGPLWGQQEGPVVGSHNHQAVELFFLNDQKQFLHIQCIPSDACRAKLFDLSRNESRVAPALDLATFINGSMWTGKSTIPGTYLPSKVTKFNSVSVHGQGTSRTHFALYPSLHDKNKTDLPNLTSFRPIEMTQLDPAHNDFTISHIWDLFLKRQYQFTIRTAWDGTPLLKTKFVSVTLSGVPQGLSLRVESPFYNDTIASTNVVHRKSNRNSYLFEDVEVFFLNEDNQYIQLELTAQGFYYVALFKSKHKVIYNHLPLNITTFIYGSKWISETVIPMEYFPPKVRKLNVAAQHGLQYNRKYIALSPSTGSPDFHNLASFKKFDMKSKLKLSDEVDSAVSPIWESSLKGEYPYTIEKTWDGKMIPEDERVTIILKAIEGNTDVSIKIDAPFHNATVLEDQDTGSTEELSNIEVVEIFFLNAQRQYVHLIFSPDGQYNVFLLNGLRNVVADSLPLAFTPKIKGSRWKGEAIVPWQYFPLHVSKFNVYSIYGGGKTRRHLALYPADGTTKAPDLDNFDFFGRIDIQLLKTYLRFNYLYSSVWGKALLTERMLLITQTWDGQKLPKEEKVFVSVKRKKNSTHFVVRIQSQFYNDSALPGQLGPSYRGLSGLEAVDVYFLNEKDQYLQVTISPHGHYYVTLRNGKGNVIAGDFPLNLDVFFQHKDREWIGVADIPPSYFPPQVRRFSASAQHGEGRSRKHITLTPSQENPPVLDLQNLDTFLQFNMKTIWNLSDEVDSTYTPIWSSALKGEFPFVITKTWNGKEIPEEQEVNLKFSKVENSPDVFLEIDSPFYGDPAPPSVLGKFIYGIWNYEAIEVQFLNDDNGVNIDISPHGYSFVVLLYASGHILQSRTSLPINVTTEIEGSRWTANVTIPAQYFPTNVSRFNAFSMSGKQYERRYLALYPVDGTVIKSDFRDVKFAQPTQMHSILPYNDKYSSIWIYSMKKFGR